MSAPERISTRVATPVASLQDLDPLAARAVLYLRLWGAGKGGQAAVEADLTAGLGAVSGADAAGVIADFADLCSAFARRPLLRHGPSCQYVGADEMCLAQLVAAAAEGAREDASMLAMVLVRADIAPGLVALAKQLGLAMRRLARAHAAADAPTATGPCH